jgi:hypothetical protein
MTKNENLKVSKKIIFDLFRLLNILFFLVSIPPMIYFYKVEFRDRFLTENIFYLFELIISIVLCISYINYNLIIRHAKIFCFIQIILGISVFFNIFIQIYNFGIDEVRKSFLSIEYKNDLIVLLSILFFHLLSAFIIFRNETRSLNYGDAA